MVLGFVVLAAVVCAVSGVKPHKWCSKDHPILDGLLCYKACKPGYAHEGGGPVCWAICPPKTTNIGVVCIKDTYVRGVGKPLSTCTPEAEKNGLLCYKQCKEGYVGAGPGCWKPCDNEYTDDGALCRRNAHIFTRDVGDCPWHDKCGLCGGPWYNVCGKRRKCGKPCPEKYHDDGCFCRRDVHIYAKSSYLRGVGSPMICKPDEEQNAGLCYKHCDSHFVGVGPVCWAKCSGKTKDTGTQCEKWSYTRGVGQVINCIKIPTLKDITNYTGLVEIFKKSNDFAKLKAIGCSLIYAQTKFWITMAQTFNGCRKESDWQTVSVSYSSGGTSGVSVSAEVGIAVDIHSSKGICYSGYCTGVQPDISFSAELAFGWWKNLDAIPGEGMEYSVGFEIPIVEIGFAAVFCTEMDGQYVGTMFQWSIGVGVLPIEVGFSKCNTPEETTVPFTM